jgi:hypothetical protein
MTRIIWDEVGKRRYETGVDRGVLYVDNVGVPWNGLISVDESPSGGDTVPYYMDGEKYLALGKPEEFEATINAYYSPLQFDLCDGAAQFAAPGIRVTQQRRKSFGLCYRTRLGTDTAGTDFGYVLHVVYNARAEPTQRNYRTLGSTADPLSLSWNLTTKPMKMSGVRNAAHITINSTEVDPAGLEAIEDVLYGDADYAPRLITPQEIVDIFLHPFEFTVTENGDGTYTIAGPLAAVENLGNGTFRIENDTVVILDPDTAEISSDED